jgi:hypothetical protein
MAFALTKKQLKQSTLYRKTEMRTHLLARTVNPLREFIDLPKTVADARTVLLMFLDSHVELQTAKPSRTLDNLITFALAQRSATGRKLNLSMEEDDIDLAPEEEEEKPLKKSKAKKETEEDPELVRQMERYGRKLLAKKERKELEARLKELERMTTEEEEKDE